MVTIGHVVHDREHGDNQLAWTVIALASATYR